MDSLSCTSSGYVSAPPKACLFKNPPPCWAFQVSSATYRGCAVLHNGGSVQSLFCTMVGVLQCGPSTALNLIGEFHPESTELTEKTKILSQTQFFTVSIFGLDQAS
ncbi:hypothetical protein KIL84_012253 [Mauremys mutica]|uniref:Uncharacterized protein n=1 Tax=Mauremys mutica TaxID=74926 RepID=A0A9D3XF78_9SAUR|nr:hypothetical protein KIL84_012253 [Mauremys mutica]